MMASLDGVTPGEQPYQGNGEAYLILESSTSFGIPETAEPLIARTTHSDSWWCLTAGRFRRVAAVVRT